VVSEAEGRVVYVLPGSPGWNDGLRPGFVVVRLTSGLNPESWRLVASDGRNLYSAGFERHLRALRDAVLVAWLAVGLALAAALAIRRPRLASGLAVLSVVLAGAAVMPSGDPGLTTLMIALGTTVQFVWVAMFAVRRALPRALAIASAICLVGAWVVARHAEPSLFDAAEALRQTAMGGGTLSVVVLLGDWRRLVRRILVAPSTWVDIAAGLLMLGVAVAVVLALGLPPVAIIGILLPAVLLYPRFRRAVTASADRLLLEEVRDRASIHAVEDERSRIARDLHDAPLQEIAAAIRRLDGKPGTESETEILRSAADHLRRLTSELRPPILDDLGLGAALSYVVEQAAEKEPAIATTLQLEPDDPLMERCPADIELGVFRIVQEAVDNALMHSGTERIEVKALIEPTRIRASVRDWGKGLTDVAARDAAHAGHLGLVSMRQRAALIGARLSIEPGTPQGTFVTLAWTKAG
jgi:signal transduction histidine kinase